MEPPRKRARPASFKIEIPGDSNYRENILSGMQEVRQYLTRKLNHPVSNGDIFDHVLHFWKTKREQPLCATLSLGQIAKQDECDQELYVVAQTSLDKFLEIAQQHDKVCPLPLKRKKSVYHGHTVFLTLSCGTKHKYKWASSPALPNGDRLVNQRVSSAIITSGMLPVVYQRFAIGAGIGCIDRKKRKSFSEVYSEVIEEEYNESCQQAILEEVASYTDLSEGIEVLGDARHGWRKNAKDCSVVGIGEKSHKVISCQHITKADDHVSQRHETIGTIRIIEELEGKEISVKTWAHDFNSTINKVIREKGINNQNDLWHGIKNIKKKMSTIARGPKYSHGKTWSIELEDKIDAVANHIYWASQNCDNDPDTFKSFLDNMLPHFRNEHSNCHSSARCQRDPNYEPSKTPITCDRAKQLFLSVLHTSTIYKNYSSFSGAKETHYVESFNNVMNIFQDKRISFSDREYNTRAHLATVHWNENVDRDHTSVWITPSAGNRKERKKKNYRGLTYNYRKNIWKRHISNLFDGE